jgi:hypothetical protein
MQAGGQSIVLIGRLLGNPGIKIHNLDTAFARGSMPRACDVGTLLVLRGASALGQGHQTVQDSPGKPGLFGRCGNRSDFRESGSLGCAGFSIVTFWPRLSAVSLSAINYSRRVLLRRLNTFAVLGCEPFRLGCCFLVNVRPWRGGVALAARSVSEVEGVS